MNSVRIALAIATLFVALVIQACTVPHHLIIRNLGDYAIQVRYQSGSFDAREPGLVWRMLETPLIGDAKKYKKIDRYEAIPVDDISLEGDGIVSIEIPPKRAVIVGSTEYLDLPRREVEQAFLTTVTPYGERRLVRDEVKDGFRSEGLAISVLEFRPHQSHKASAQL